MNDNELDDLFRSNADYLADQPPRSFDKDAFWQQLQTAIPPKNDRPKKPIAWDWAAVAALVAGVLAGIWWVQPETGGRGEELAQQAQGTAPAENSAQPQSWSVAPQTEERVAQGTPSTMRSVPNKRIPPQISDPGKGKRTFKSHEQPIQQVSAQSTVSENLPATLEIEEYSLAEPVVEATNLLPESAGSAAPEKPSYRVVHINEIKERKQQETKARTRLAVRVGVPSGTRVTTPSDYSSPLSIPIQN